MDVQQALNTIALSSASTLMAVAIARSLVFEPKTTVTSWIRLGFLGLFLGIFGFSVFSTWQPQTSTLNWYPITYLLFGLFCISFPRQPVLLADQGNEPSSKSTDSSRSMEDSRICKAILMETVEAIMVCDEYGTIRSVNRTFERVFDCSRGQVIDAHISLFFSDSESHKIVNSARPSLDEARLFNRMQAVTVRRLDGHEFQAEVASGKISDGRRSYLVLSVQDTTERQQAEQLLIDSRDAAIRAQAAALQGAQAKSQFIANISHEIRTPMNGIIGMVDLLQKSATNQRQRSQLRVVRECSNSLLNIVNDVLDFSKIEAGKVIIETKKFSLTSLLESCVQLFQSAGREKGVKVKLHLTGRVPDQVYGDPTRIRQIIVNLLNNAIKFTDAGSVTVKGSAAPSDDGKLLVRIGVQDTGIGIPIAKQETLFRSFEQVDPSATRKYGGTGLGLAICKGIVQAMDGQIGLHSKEGIGSEFFFVFKTDDGGDSKEVQLESAGVDEIPANLTILVAEDNQINRLLIENFFENLGIEVDLASDGQAVVDAVQAKKYDIIFMDCQMPKLDGYDATRIIRNTISDTNQPRIIALTANALDGDLDKCMNAGMDGYLTKPLTLDDLRAAILSNTSSHSMANRSASPSTDDYADTRNWSAIDTRYLRAAYGRSTALAKACEAFSREHPRMLQQCDQARRLGDLDKIKQQMHAFQGLCLSLGSRHVPSLIEKLIAAVNAEESATISQRIEDIRLAAGKLATELNQYIEDGKDDNPA